MDKKKEEFINRIKAALERAQQETDQLSLSIPSPLRDRFFSALMDELAEDNTHDIGHCPGCINSALSMALSALGWEDRMAPRPGSATERMSALLEQVTIALKFLDNLHSEGLHGDLRG